jgi:hypothetical protein
MAKQPKKTTKKSAPKKANGTKASTKVEAGSPSSNQ